MITFKNKTNFFSSFSDFTPAAAKIIPSSLLSLILFILVSMFPLIFITDIFLLIF